MNDIAPEQRQAMFEIGQKVVDLLGNEINAKGLGDLQFVIDILVSVSSYYLSGIGDEKIREELCDQFGAALRENIDAHIKAGRTASIQVFDATKSN